MEENNGHAIIELITDADDDDDDDAEHVVHEQPDGDNALDRDSNIFPESEDEDENEDEDEDEDEDENEDEDDRQNHMSDRISHGEETYMDMDGDGSDSDEQEEIDFLLVITTSKIILALCMHYLILTRQNLFPQHDNEENFQDNYKSVLNAFSRDWLLAKLKHRVSGKAANKFWDICMEFMPTLLQMKEREGITRSIPKFKQQRKNLYKNRCPVIKMEFGFRNKTTGAITKVTSSKAPRKTFERNPQYTKLYEMAYIKVCLAEVIYMYILCVLTKLQASHGLVDV